MPKITKGTTFQSGDTVTADSLNELIDNAEFVAGSDGATDNTTLAVHSDGYLMVKDNGVGDEHLQQMTDAEVSTASNENGRAVTTNHIRNDAVTTAKIASNAVTTAKIDSGVPLVPDPGTTNNRKILTAGSTAGSYSWKHNNEELEVTTYTNTLSIAAPGKFGTTIFWPTVQSSTMTTYRSGRNAWIVGGYILNTNYPSISNDHAFFLINMPNTWKALGDGSSVAFLSNGWHRSYASPSTSSNTGSSSAGHIGRAGIQILPGSTNHAIELSVIDWSGFYLVQGWFAVNFLLDDTSMNS